jgi:transposase
VELFEAIRRDRRRDGLSIRELAVRHWVHRRAVRAALASAVPPPRKARVFAAPVLDPVKPLIDAMLRQDLEAPTKQRHTARRVLARLVDEHGVETVRGYVARRRPEIVAEANRPVEDGCVPQRHDPGAEAEVDFHDLWVILRGVKTKTALFTMRLSFSGRAGTEACAPAPSPDEYRLPPGKHLPIYADQGKELALGLRVVRARGESIDQGR